MTSAVSKRGMTRNFTNSLVAVLVGNALYLAVSPWLPAAARHESAGMDLGVVVDFWMCLVVLGLLRLWQGYKKGRGGHRLL